MWLKKVLIVIVGFLVLSGCSEYFMICSLHPFYLDKNVVLSSGIEGFWSTRPLFPESTAEKTDVWFRLDTLSTWKIERYISKSTQKTAAGKDSIVLNPLNFYEVKLITSSPDSTQYSFKMVFHPEGQHYPL
jgi:hypothetical protein